VPSPLTCALGHMWTAPSWQGICSRLQVVVGAAMCSACLRGSHVMPSADQVPVISSHSTMLWPKWVVLIAGSTDSALTCCSPSQPSHHARCLARSHLSRKRGGFLVAFAPGHDRPRHPCDFVGERDSRDLRGSPRQQHCEPGPMPGAMDFGIADHRQRAGREQAAQIAIAAFADITEPVLASA
jgi:hypothetical protein